MSGHYVPPHLRNKAQKTSFNQKSHSSGQRFRIEGSEFNRSKNIPIPRNSRFNGMFDSYPSTLATKYQTPNTRTRKKFGLDCKRCGCIVLYSKRHDSIYLMGSEKNTHCIKIHPETGERKCLLDLPYFDKDETAESAYFDKNENFIFILSQNHSYTAGYPNGSIQVIKYDILKNRIVDSYSFRVHENYSFIEAVTAVTYKKDNEYYTDFFAKSLLWNQSIKPGETSSQQRFFFHYSKTSSQQRFDKTIPNEYEVLSIDYQSVSAYSAKTKELYVFGWGIVSTNEFCVMVRESESGNWKILTIPMDHLERFEFYGFCMVDERYCIFVGGKRRSTPTSTLHDEICVYDVVLKLSYLAPVKLYQPLCKVGCTYDENRRILHLIGALEQHNCILYNTYSKIKFYKKLNIRDVIPGFTDLRLTESIMEYWFGNSEKIWNHDITKIIYNYV